jgi:CubicO group peptidase (beta-lactamase class C family)
MKNIIKKIIFISYLVPTLHWFILDGTSKVLLKPKQDIKNDTVKKTCDDLEKFIKKESLPRWRDPGIFVGVVLKGKIFWSYTHGHTDITKKIPINAQTKFLLASLTKTMTATVAKPIFDKLSINFDDPVDKYFSDFSLRNHQAVTFKDFFAHRLPIAPFRFDSLWYTGWKPHQLLPLIARLKNIEEKKVSYQNWTYALIGDLLMQMQSKPLEQLYRELLFDPLHMDHTSLGIDGDLIQKEDHSIFRKIKKLLPFQHQKTAANVAIPHDYDQQRQVRKIGFNPALNRFLTTSSVLSSGEDMCKWMLFWLNKGKVDGQQIIDIDHMNAMTTPGLPLSKKALGQYTQFPIERMGNVSYSNMGGWYVGQYGVKDKTPPVDILFHMGGSFGARSSLYLIPSFDMGIIILSNLGGMTTSLHPEAIAFTFMDYLLSNQFQLNLDEEGLEKNWAKGLYDASVQMQRENQSEFYEEKLLHPSPHDNLSDLVGVYSNKTVGSITVGLDTSSNQLFMTYNKKHKISLTHHNGNTFFFEASKLSKGYNGLIAGIMIFGKNKENQKPAIHVSSFFDTEDQMFFKNE